MVEHRRGAACERTLPSHEFWKFGHHFGAFGRGEVHAGQATAGGLSTAADGQRFGHDSTAATRRTAWSGLLLSDTGGFSRRSVHDGEFIECFEVFGRGYWYGTLRREVATGLAAGKWVLLEIDVQGMRAVVAQYPEAISFFVRTANLEELEHRLRGRGTETEETIQRRLEVARQEWQFKDQYTYEIVNDSLEAAASEICRLLMRSADS